MMNKTSHDEYSRGQAAAAFQWSRLDNLGATPPSHHGSLAVLLTHNLPLRFTSPPTPPSDRRRLCLLYSICHSSPRICRLHFGLVSSVCLLLFVMRRRFIATPSRGGESNAAGQLHQGLCRYLAHISVTMPVSAMDLDDNVE